MIQCHLSNILNYLIRPSVVDQKEEAEKKDEFSNFCFRESLEYSVLPEPGRIQHVWKTHPWHHFLYPAARTTTLCSALHNFSLHTKLPKPTKRVWEIVSNVPNTQSYGRSRQCGRPVGALIEWEFHSNPLINGLIQHTFMNLLFVENFQMIP